MKLYTPIKYQQEKLVNWVLSWFPSYILQVVYIPEQSSEIEYMYSVHDCAYWHQQNNRIFKDGYYIFVFWNKLNTRVEKIVLHSDHIKKALESHTLSNLWAYSDEGLITLLTHYINTKKSSNLMDLLYDGVSVYKSLLLYKHSLEVPQNITARLVYILSQSEEKKTIDVKKEDHTVIYYDDTLEEYKSNLDEFLVQ